VLYSILVPYLPLYNMYHVHHIQGKYVCQPLDHAIFGGMLFHEWKNVSCEWGVWTWINILILFIDAIDVEEYSSMPSTFSHGQAMWHSWIQIASIEMALVCVMSH
jgi:hypothetical protein